MQLLFTAVRVHRHFVLFCKGALAHIGVPAYAAANKRCKDCQSDKHYASSLGLRYRWLRALLLASTCANALHWVLFPAFECTASSCCSAQAHWHTLECLHTQQHISKAMPFNDTEIVHCGARARSTRVILHRRIGTHWSACIRSSRLAKRCL
jgi:hypothetical protein